METQLENPLGEQVAHKGDNDANDRESQGEPQRYGYDVQAIYFHELKLRHAMKEPPWRRGGIFCSPGRTARGSLFREKGRWLARLPVRPYRNRIFAIMPLSSCFSR